MPKELYESGKKDAEGRYDLLIRVPLSFRTYVDGRRMSQLIWDHFTASYGLFEIQKSVLKIRSWDLRFWIFLDSLEVQRMSVPRCLGQFP